MSDPSEGERRCDGCQFYMAAMKAVWMGRYWGKREEQPRWGGCKKQRLAGNQDVSRYRAVEPTDSCDKWEPRNPLGLLGAAALRAGEGA